jgi:hypothetical protein
MSARQAPRRENGKAKIVTVAELEQRYPEQWVLLEITRDAKDPRRVAGRLLAHSSDRDEFDEAFLRFRAEHPETRVYRFFTGDVVRADEDVVIIL